MPDNNLYGPLHDLIPLIRDTFLGSNVARQKSNSSMIYFSFNHLSVAYGRRELLRERND